MTTGPFPLPENCTIYDPFLCFTEFECEPNTGCRHISSMERQLRPESPSHRAILHTRSKRYPTLRSAFKNGGGVEKCSQLKSDAWNNSRCSSRSNSTQPSLSYSLATSEDTATSPRVLDSCFYDDSAMSDHAIYREDGNTMKSVSEQCNVFAHCSRQKFRNLFCSSARCLEAEPGTDFPRSCDENQYHSEHPTCNRSGPTVSFLDQPAAREFCQWVTIHDRLSQNTPARGGTVSSQLHDLNFQTPDRSPTLIPQTTCGAFQSDSMETRTDDGFNFCEKFSTHFLPYSTNESLGSEPEQFVPEPEEPSPLDDVVALFGDECVSILEGLAPVSPSFEDFSSPGAFIGCSPSTDRSSSTTSSTPQTSGSSVSPATSSNTNDGNGNKRKRQTGGDDPPNDDGDDGEPGANREFKQPKLKEEKLSKIRWDCPFCRRPLGSTSGGCYSAHDGLEFRYLPKHFRDSHYGCEICGLRYTKVTAERHLYDKSMDPSKCQVNKEAAAQIDLALPELERMKELYECEKKNRQTLVDYQRIWAAWWNLIWGPALTAPNGVHQGKISYPSADISHLHEMVSRMWQKAMDEKRIPQMSDQVKAVLLEGVEQASRQLSFYRQHPKVRAGVTVTNPDPVTEAARPELVTSHPTFGISMQPNWDAGQIFPDFGGQMTSGWENIEGSNQTVLPARLNGTQNYWSQLTQDGDYEAEHDG